MMVYGCHCACPQTKSFVFLNKKTFVYFLKTKQTNKTNQLGVPNVLQPAKQRLKQHRATGGRTERPQ